MAVSEAIATKKQGLVTKKKKIFDEIGAFVSMMEEMGTDNSTNLYPSINNKEDAIAFMIDLLKTITGSDALQKAVGDLMTKFADNVEPELKTGLKKQAVPSTSDDPLPTAMTTNGITFPVSGKKGIDLSGQYSGKNPYSAVALLTNDVSTKSFDTAIRNAIATPDTEIPFGNNNLLTIKYNEVDDTATFKPKTGIKVGEFLLYFIDSLVIIDKKVFTASIMNSLYGTTSANQGKTQQQIENELIANVLIEKTIDQNPDVSILSTDMFSISEKANNMMNGVALLDVGCGILEASLSVDDLTDLANNVSGSTDAFAVANYFLTTFDKSLATTQNTAVAENNKGAINDGFFTRLIKAIQIALAASVTITPQIRTLMGFINFLTNGSSELGTIEEDFKKYKIFLTCLINEAKKLINEFIFNMVKTALVRLLLPIGKKILREKINYYIGIIRSLIPIKT
jgi:hypothetical protein